MCRQHVDRLQAVCWQAAGSVYVGYRQCVRSLQEACRQCVGRVQAACRQNTGSV